MKLERYDLIIDVHYPEDAAIMFPTESGHWVSSVDAEEKIDFLVRALANLRDCNVELTERAHLNEYVNRVLMGYLK